MMSVWREVRDCMGKLEYNESVAAVRMEQAQQGYRRLLLIWCFGTHVCPGMKKRKRGLVKYYYNS
jgi:hypothetical protein